MKKKVWDITVLDNPNRAVMGENDEFYTTDTEAFLVFELADANFKPKNALLTLINRNDKSVVSEVVNVVDGVIKYELREEVITHYGNWQAQLVYRQPKDGITESYTSQPIQFVVEGHIASGQLPPPPLEIIESWELFMLHAQDFLDGYDGRLTNVENNKADQSDVDEVTAQLAQKVSEVTFDSVRPTPENLNISSNNGKRKPFISFVDDDGREQAYSVFAPILEAEGMVGTLAITTELVNQSRYVTTGNLQELQSRGWEIASHNYNDVYFDSDNLNAEEIEYQAVMAKKTLNDMGLVVQNHVYTGGQRGGDEGMRIIKRHFKSAYSTGTSANNHQHNIITDEMFIRRIDGDVASLNHLKSQVDRCISEGNWMIIMSHVGTWNAETTQKYKDLVAYISSLNVGVGTLNEGYEIFGNTLSVGYEEPIRILNTGQTYGSGIGQVYRRHDLEGNLIDEGTPLNGFEKNKTTITRFEAISTDNFPVRGDSILTTVRAGDGGYNTYQRWITRPRAGEKSREFERWYDGTIFVGQWTSWVERTEYKRSVSFIVPQTNFPVGEITEVEIDLSEYIGVAVDTRELAYSLNTAANSYFGMIYNPFIDKGVLHLRFYNVSGPTSRGAREWFFTWFV